MHLPSIILGKICSGDTWKITILTGCISFFIRNLTKPILTGLFLLKEHLNQVLLNGKGCILVHGHFGPAQLPLFALGLKGYNINQLGLPSDEGLSLVGKKVAFKIRQVYEGMIPARIVSAESFLRPLFKHLETNGILMMTGDGTGGDKFVGKFLPVKFFNQEVLFPTGYAALSLKTGAPILPLFTIRKRFNLG